MLKEPQASNRTAPEANAGAIDKGNLLRVVVVNVNEDVMCIRFRCQEEEETRKKNEPSATQRAGVEYSV